MERFLDVVKVNLGENIARFFSEVEVESVKRSKKTDTLNFYLVSRNYIPYDYIKTARKIMAEQLVNYNEDSVEVINGVKTNPINLIIKYDLPETYTPKLIYEDIKVDLYKEIKEKNITCAAFFIQDNIEFLNDTDLLIKFDHIVSFEKYQQELVDTLKAIFKERFGKELNVFIQWLEYSANEKEEKPKPHYDNKDISKIDKQEQKDETNGESKLSKLKSRSSTFMLDGDILYGRKSKTKRRFVEINSIMADVDNITVNGIIYNIRKRELKKNNKCIFYLSIHDAEGCIVVKIWGEPKDVNEFNLAFRIGDEIEIDGKAYYDSFDHEMVIKPQCITKIAHHDVIEFGKLGDEDYYNVVITDREDNEKEKRVELHLHTKYSARDGVGEVKAYIDTAQKFGMTAMAITDHGCVNALADAYEYISKKKKDGKNSNLKIINGVEGYLVEDFETYYFDNENNFSNRSHTIDSPFVLYELTTTGFNRKNDAVIKIEAIKIENGKAMDSFKTFVRYDKPIPFLIHSLTGISDSDVSNAPDMKTAFSNFIDFCKGAVLVTFSKNTVWGLHGILKDLGIEEQIDILDLSILARLMLKELKTADLISIAKELKIKIVGITDRKKSDRKNLTSEDKLKVGAPIFEMLLSKIKSELEITDIKDLSSKLDIGENFVKRQKSYHIILLAKNDVGRVNLYKLVSEASVHYMYKKLPRMPRSLINKYREGLIIGSACIIGEFMNAIKNGVDDERLKEIASFYDYLEIQPTLNNSFLLNDDSENFKSIKDLEDLNKKVIEIADAVKKPVVATCDCHYIDKEDKVYREVLRIGTSYKKANIDDATKKLKSEVKDELESSNKEELYFRTTKEMLDEFSYLGVDKAYEVVIKNTNLISNMVEDILPLRKDNCPPHIEGSDDELTNACKENLTKIFGDNANAEIKDRLDKELKYIIDNGYSVMYIAAKKLIDFSKENGYPVGSRGSVGSSLAATLSGVSEVNPLKPYYICPKCHHLEYDTEETKKYENDTGFDMPDKVCPDCGTQMHKDGVNIPFETFLGIPGNENAQKEPDIDLNFCSVYQSRIHDKTIELFGKENTFKAGTVGTVAAKTAFGYVKTFAEVAEVNLNDEQINYYRNKIINCKNTTGQHPGGMVVVPKGEEIYTFTPIQLAADKEGNDVTTHYDYHKIDKNLLKLDILGHDSPLMLKKLSSLTGEDYNRVPFYEKEVLKLFEDTSSLGITSADISGTRLGCLSIPEFGTDFAMNMCEDAKPKTVADLIRIAGLAHGTDVWQGNVQDLIKNGDCTLSSAICCRDDIMIYLIEKGLNHGMSFNIMESVRKGNGLKNEWIDEMKKHDVPDWYIDCCKKIKYMFPKAHAAAYVLASLRIAYYKIHYPKEYYAAYFSIKKDGIDYKLMMQSKEDLHYQIEKISRIINERKSKDNKFKSIAEEQEKPLDAIEKMYRNLGKDVDTEEKEDLSSEEILNQKYEKMSAKNLLDLHMCYRIVEEMKARGIDFCPIDIYKAKRSDFQVIDGKIMPSFDSIPGIGTKEIDIDYNLDVAKNEKSTAMKCELEGMNGTYNSIEDFSNRTGVNKTIIEEMKKLGLFEGLKESDKNTIFDYI